MAGFQDSRALLIQIGFQAAGFAPRQPLDDGHGAHVNRNEHRFLHELIVALPCVDPASPGHSRLHSFPPTPEPAAGHSPVFVAETP